MRNASPITKVSSLLALTLTLTACTQGTAPVDPLQSFKEQKINWAKCDPTILPLGPISTKQIGDRVQCADIKVPLDWSKPDRGTISMGLLRVTASKPDTRQGSIFVNPGGPGGDGLTLSANLALASIRADPKTPAGVALNKLSEQYDMIGFSPRGTGQSSRLTCGSNEQSSAEQYPSEDRSQANIDAMLRNARLVAQACLKNPITPYINTDQTARDLELTRQLLGDAKMNYIGYSYGTWLGAWYAKLFPQSTGRFLLDGNTAFAGNFEDSFNEQPLGFERAFRDSALAYAARHPVFELGATKEVVYGVYNAFPSAVKLALQLYPGDLIGSLYTDDGIVTVPVSLVAARGLSEVLKANPALKTGEDLAPLLEKYVYAKNENLNALARNAALALLGSYLDIINKVIEPIELGYDNSVFTAVVNNDTPATQDPQFWIDFGNKEAVAHPLIGGGYTENSAIYWTKPTTTKPATPANLPPILLLQNELDPATPKEGALQALNSLPSAKMIFVDNEAQHTAFPYDDQCVDLQVANYFLSGTMPDKKFNVCAAKALPALALPGDAEDSPTVPAETQVYPVGETYTTGDTIPAQALQRGAFTSPDAAETLKQIKDIIKRNAIQPRR
jgi:pimeloyl-ACP methyl ester carboxylesterase